MPTETAHTSLRIEKLVYGGDGLARSDSGVILTPFVLPGELVQCTVKRAKNDLLRGTLVAIEEPAPQRVEPRCPYFRRCGGCHYQHAAYEYQAEQKCAILREVLRRVGHFDFEGEIGLVTGEPWHYRNRVQLHIHEGRIGYFGPGSHALVAIEECPIASPKLNETIAGLAASLPRYRWFDATVELFTNETDVQVNVADRIPGSARPLFEAAGSSEPIEYGAFRVSRNSFFQVNRFLIDRLVELAAGGLEGGHAVDLYAGAGLFATRLAAQFRQVTAVESSGNAFRDLEFNVQRAGLRVAAIRETAENYLSSLAEAPDLIVADPPRTGLGKRTVSQLLRLRAPKLALVCCDPATLARDLKPLVEAGYQCRGMTVIDLFPQTFHLETVAMLEI